MNRYVVAAVLSFLSFSLSAQNVLEQKNNISAAYDMNYQTTMNSVAGTLLNGSAASIKALAAFSNNQIPAKYLQEQSKKFKMHFRTLQDGGRPSLKPATTDQERWCTYTYFTMDNTSSINYFLQLKVVFVKENPIPVSRLKIGDDVPASKIKSIKVLDGSELFTPNSAAVYEALQESDMFMRKVSSQEFQQMMNKALKKPIRKK